MCLFMCIISVPKKSQEEFVVSDTDDLSTLLVDAEDATPHGKCNAVYVGYAPSVAQVAALTAYSIAYKVLKQFDTFDCSCCWLAYCCCCCCGLSWRCFALCRCVWMMDE